MIKKVFSIVLLLSAMVFCQQNTSQNPSVELPDFVITGKDIISVPKATKLPPGFISMITKDYINPSFSPDILTVPDFLLPITNTVSLSDTTKVYNSYVQFEAGRYTLPQAKVFYGAPFQNGIFDAFFKGNNQLAYVDNSNYSIFLTGLDFKYYVPENSSAFGGTQILLGGDYGSSTFKFFGSTDPTLNRTINKGDININVRNLASNTFTFDLKSINNFTALPNEGFSENLYKFKGFGKAEFGRFALGLDLTYEKQFLTISRTANAVLRENSYDNYLNLKPFMGLQISDLLNVRFGVDYSKSGSSNYFSPFGEIAFNMGDGLSLLGEFYPHGEFLSNGEFLRQNRYYNPPNSLNVFTKKTFDIKGMLKYEYGDSFEIDGGITYFSASNLPYFIDAPVSGKFDILTVDADSYTWFIKTLFHMGRFGVLYGNAELNSTKHDGNFLPYYPVFKASATYGYYFSSALNAEVNLKYFSKSYTDVNNLISLPDFVDLGFKFDYSFLKQLHFILELSNLTNNSNYQWRGYEGLPLNVKGGFLFRW